MFTPVLKFGPLSVRLHRTVRVAEGRSAAQLPPSRDYVDLYPVKEFRASCPESWEDDAVFGCLHPKEALWLSFHVSTNTSVAIICGAGGVNALTGDPLTLQLAEGNYMVAPPQPWLDGWKDKDSGHVFQFVATEYKKGAGNTVAEQLIGEKSKSGGIGLAVFEAKDPKSLKPQSVVGHSAIGGPYSQPMEFSPSGAEAPTKHTMIAAHDESFHLCSAAPRGAKGQGLTGTPIVRAPEARFVEQGLGKGGAIVQKIYPDPHGLDAWKPEPTAVKAIYIVSAEGFAAITGKPVPPEVVSDDKYAGPYFQTHDAELGDVAGSAKFTGLKSVFQEPEPTPAAAPAEPAVAGPQP